MRFWFRLIGVRERVPHIQSDFNEPMSHEAERNAKHTRQAESWSILAQRFDLSKRVEVQSEQ